MMTSEKSDGYLKKAEQEEGKRIYRFLKLLEQGSVYDFSEQSPYEESILSREVKMYFSQFAEQQVYPTVLEEENSPYNAFLQQICSVFQLDAFEKMCVELAMLGEVNLYFEKFFIYMNNDWNNGYLTIDTAIKLYKMDQEEDISFYKYFSEENTLLKYFFRFYGQEGKGRVRWGLRIRSYFFQFLFSEPDSPYDMFSFLKWYQTADRENWDDCGSALLKQIDVIIGLQTAAIYLRAERNTGIEQIIRQYSSMKNHMLCFIDIKQVLFQLEKKILNITLEELCNDILLKARVRDAWICVHYCDSEFLEREDNWRLVVKFTEAFLKHGIVVFIIGEHQPYLFRNELGIWEISVEIQDLSGSVPIWKMAAENFSVDRDVTLDFFANTYCFAPIQIKRIFQYADTRRILHKRDKILREDIKAGCIRETEKDGNRLLTVMDTGYRWEDLILPDRQKELLRMACNRVLYKHQVYHTWGFGAKLAYGRGVSMVFSGPPGTGKTMSAGIVADYLGSTLYRVDLAAVVSKYIGETEKNLNIVFETVKKGRGVLFFDEADVLFSKRTEVENSNDKHSNMEVAYLLQKMEEYEGVVILATNYMQNMDEAFKRRIQFLIEFPFPDENLRRKIWEKAFPEQMEFDEMPDYAFLAKQFELSGSHIKNIALQAAFFAANEKSAMCMKYIIKALILEIRKTGKRISQGDLREYYMYYENN